MSCVVPVQPQYAAILLLEGGIIRSQYKYTSSAIWVRVPAFQTQDPLRAHLSYFSSASVRMVNFRDPTVVALDSRTYSFELHLEFNCIMIVFF